MKRTLAILLCAALALAGCAQAPTATPGDTPSALPATPSPTPEPTLEATPTPTATPIVTPSPTVYVFDTTKSVTTGLDKKLPYKPVAVMIENTVDARPQKGLNQADIVYEVLVENVSMTRFMCVFNDNLPQNVGPVRSLRKYYVDLADEYAGALSFFGGAEGKDVNIYTRLESSPLKVAANGIQGKWGKYYWRSKDKKAPHNVYTDLTKIAALFDELPLAHHFLFGAANPAAGDAITKIHIPYNKTTLNTEYVYDPQTNKYNRLANGKPFMDGLDNKQVAVTNVIVQNTNLTFTHDFKGRILVDFIGTGTADVFTAGRYIKATWEKKSATDPTIYRDEQGNEIVLQPGNTWVEVVYDKIQYSYGN